MQIKCTSFADDSELPDHLTCRGEGKNPAFAINDVPKEARSLALIMHDPDAIHGDFIHWTVWNIDPATTKILEAAAPTGSTEGVNTAGRPGYLPPCPPEGTGRHRYVFELFALDDMLDMAATMAPDEVVRHLHTHALATTHTIGIVHAPAG